MGAISEHFNSLSDAHERERQRRIALNTSAGASSLADLAILRHKESQQHQAEKMAEAAAAHSALRADYLRQKAERGQAELPGLIAQLWDLPVDHPFINTLEWAFVMDGWQDALYESVDGKVRVTPMHGTKLTETYETQ